MILEVAVYEVQTVKQYIGCSVQFWGPILRGMDLWEEPGYVRSDGAFINVSLRGSSLV